MVALSSVCRVHWELWGAGAFLLSLSLFQKVAHVFSFFLKLIYTPSSHPHFSSFYYRHFTSPCWSASCYEGSRLSWLLLELSENCI